MVILRITKYSFINSHTESLAGGAGAAATSAAGILTYPTFLGLSISSSENSP